MQQVRFWGKYSREKRSFLPLAAHCLDVAMVFRALCDLPGFRRMLLCSTRQDLNEVHLARLSVMAMYHDVGKANLGFQNKVLGKQVPRAGHIRELAPLLCEKELVQKFLHNLPRGMDEWFSDPTSADSYFFAIFSHHGKPFSINDDQLGNYWNAKNWWYPEGSRDPMSAIREISALAEKAFPEAWVSSDDPLPSEPRFHHRFAGLVMLADWIGSHEYWFPIESTDAENRLKRNSPIIQELLKSIGLDVRSLRPSLQWKHATFEDRFKFPPRPLQEIVDKLSVDDDSNSLIVAESETGSGKTEAALNWFVRLFAAGKVDGLYFALPTRVAARDLYSRIESYVTTWFPNPQERPVTLLAVPGYTQVDGRHISAVLPTPEEGNMSQESPEIAFLERYWAAERPKRFLAATIGVGTIDQALLGTVQSSHANLRTVCLERSLLVVDEVHASDVYMAHLLERLLQNHLGSGGYAMLLSATLGSSARTSLVDPGRRNLRHPVLSEAISDPYPLVTVRGGRQMPTVHSGKTKEVEFDVLPLANSLDQVLDKEVIPALKAGARILIVMNTVERAVRLFKALENNPSVHKEVLFNCNGQACPHHGRFSPQDRLVLDASIRSCMGKNSSKAPVVVVGTQTLEQSLDIDGDLLITDLAPADILLQRVGRLHRHERERPRFYGDPRCIVLAPNKEFEEGLASNGEVSGEFMKMGFGSVYEDLRILALTLRFLEQQSLLNIPKDNRLFVEMATHPDKLQSFVGDRWMRHRHNIEGRNAAKKITASHMVFDFNKYFGDDYVAFRDHGRMVSTRLGSNTFRFELNSTVVSPFGQILSDIFVPDYLAPEVGGDLTMVVEGKEGEAIIMRHGERRYRYSRYGLEVMR